MAGVAGRNREHVWAKRLKRYLDPHAPLASNIRKLDQTPFVLMEMPVPALPRKLIEVALPLPEINDASAYDKMPGIGAHPKGIHQWWARLPFAFGTGCSILFCGG